MILTAKGIPKTTPCHGIKIEGHTLNEVNFTRLLVISLDNKLCWKQYIDYISRKVSRAVGMVVKAFAGASLFDIFLSFLLEKYIVCDVCGLRSPSPESSSMLYISLTDTSSMQDLILQGL